MLCTYVRLWRSGQGELWRKKSHVVMYTWICTYASTSVCLDALVLFFNGFLEIAFAWYVCSGM